MAPVRPGALGRVSACCSARRRSPTCACRGASGLLEQVIGNLSLLIAHRQVVPASAELLSRLGGQPGRLAGEPLQRRAHDPHAIAGSAARTGAPERSRARLGRRDRARVLRARARRADRSRPGGEVAMSAPAERAVPARAAGSCSAGLPGLGAVTAEALAQTRRDRARLGRGRGSPRAERSGTDEGLAAASRRAGALHRHDAAGLRAAAHPGLGPRGSARRVRATPPRAARRRRRSRSRSPTERCSASRRSAAANGRPDSRRPSLARASRAAGAAAQPPARPRCSPTRAGSIAG